MESTTEKIQQKAEQITHAVEDNQNVSNTERIISGLAGAVLTIYGLKKKNTLVGKGLSIIGGMLLTRASTGFCPINKAIGRSSLNILAA